jgi:ketosteroid isomerase-like protein
MREENIKAVEAYLNALRQKDLSLAPFAEDIEFEDPISGRHTGADNFRAFLSGFLPAIKDIKILSHVCEDEFVVTHFEADGVFGVVQMLAKFRLRDGKIIEALNFFDPRPILG